MKRELRVTELAKPFAMSLNAVSKHIQILERAGFGVAVGSRAVTSCCSTRLPLEEVSTWVEKSRVFWSARLDALDELLKAENAAATPQPAEKWKPK